LKPYSEKTLSYRTVPLQEIILRNSMLADKDKDDIPSWVCSAISGLLTGAFITPKDTSDQSMCLGVEE
jgi:hypothetical protein